MKRTRQRKVIGDREKAIELLKNTTLYYKEIEQLTGVPRGTITGLALEHRPAEVRANNKRRDGHKITISLNGLESGIDKEEEKAPLPKIEKPSSGVVSRIMLFSYEAKTDAPISKKEAIEEINQLINVIESSSSNEFVFSLKTSTGGKQ